MKLGLRSRVLSAFLVLVIAVLGLFAYGSWVFRRLELQMKAVNELHIPASRLLSQLESSFFLLEADLDKGLAEGLPLPVDSLDSVIRARLEALRALVGASGNGEGFAESVKTMSGQFVLLSGSLSRTAASWEARKEHEAAISRQRGDFRIGLKSLMRDFERGAREASAAVETELRRVGLLASCMLAVCAFLAFFTAWWVSSAIRPLESLTGAVRRISEMGLAEPTIEPLSRIARGADEISILARESYKMASSFLDHHKVLREQKGNLERAHQELAQQNEALRNTKNRLAHTEKLGLVGKMAAQMAHEIRNPLNALGLHLEILERQLSGSGDVLDGLAPMKVEINKLIRVTEAYLDMAKGPVMRKTAVDLRELVQEVMHLYLPLMQEKGIALTCDVPGALQLEADRAQIAQVVGNLVKNASEAFVDPAMEKTRFVRIIGAPRSDGRQLLISVIDNGEGIPLELQKDVFSPFFTSKSGGNGLGLSFSSQVVHAHGGEISFESLPGKGSKFTVALPLGAAPSKERKAAGIRREGGACFEQKSL